MRSLLLSPVFSNYQVLESAIVNTYFANALGWYISQPDNQEQTLEMFDLMLNSPYLLYQNYGLYNPSRIVLPVKKNRKQPNLLQQQVILIIALTSVLLYHISQSDIIMVNMNGPVANEGFSSLLGIASSLGKPVLYWKDDARKLWGLNDNPMTLGLLPDVNRNIMMPSRLSNIDTQEEEVGNCGAAVLPYLVQQSMKTKEARRYFHQQSYLAKMSSLGNFIIKEFENFNFLSDKAGKIRPDVDVYNTIYDVIYNNQKLLSVSDRNFLFSERYANEGAGTGTGAVYSTVLQSRISSPADGLPVIKLTENLINALLKIHNMFKKKSKRLKNPGCDVMEQAHCTILERKSKCQSDGKCCNCDDKEGENCVPISCSKTACKTGKCNK